jgi:hypothetical protein
VIRERAPTPAVAEPLPDRALRGLIRLCASHWSLHRCLDSLYGLAVRRELADLIRADGLRLLEQAHVLELTGGAHRNDVQDLAGRALDRFERLAGQGDADAAWRVAEAHRTGFGRPGNHWRALEGYDRAAALGHPLAAERRRALAEREPIADDSHDRFGRQALLKATYARTATQHQGQLLGHHWHGFRQEGMGLRASLGIFAVAALVLSYGLLDFYFLGLGHWRPDPTRVAWGLIGRIHPPREGSARRVLPGWLRPDARDVTYTEVDPVDCSSRVVRVAERPGRVVYLHVIDAQHPLLFESQAYLNDLQHRLGDRCDVCVLYLPGLRRTDVALAWIRELAGLNAAYAHDPRGVRQLGTVDRFPMNFIIDRRGRIRQRWVGFSAALSDTALAAALAEEP